MRIGELLLQQGLITPDRLGAALAAQAQLGARVGSILVEFGYLNEDVLARALSHQLGVPAALTKHFAAIDPKVIKLIGPRIAAAHNAIPLGFTGTKPARLIVAFLDPLASSNEEIAFITGNRVDAGVAPQRQIVRNLEKYYGVKTESRSVDINFAGMPATMSSAPPPPFQDVAAPRASVVAEQKRAPPPQLLLTPPPPPPPTPAPMWDPEPQAVVAASPPRLAMPLFLEPPPPPSLPLLAAEPPVSGDWAAAAPPPAEEPYEYEDEAPDAFPSQAPMLDSSSMMMSSPPQPAELQEVPEESEPQEQIREASLPPAATLRGASVFAPELRAPLNREEAIELLGMAATRDEIGDALSDYLRTACGCGLVLIVKGDLALGWKGFASVHASVIEAVSLPLSSPSIFRTANDSRAPFRGVPQADGAVLQTRLWKILRCPPPDEVVVVPICFGKRVVNLVYAHGFTGESLPDAMVAELSDVCAAASAAYARIIRSKKAE